MGTSGTAKAVPAYQTWTALRTHYCQFIGRTCIVWKIREINESWRFTWFDRFDEKIAWLQKIHCHAKFFPSNQFIVKFFSKMLIWRNFCEKTVAVKFRDFHSVNWLHEIFFRLDKIVRFSTLFKQFFFRQINFVK